MYMGMSPFDAPATYSLLQYAKMAEGIWRPRGSFHAVLDTLVRRGEDLGLRYKLGTKCTGVVLEPDRLQDGCGRAGGASSAAPTPSPSCASRRRR